jgi:hypothetical protein
MGITLESNFAHLYLFYVYYSKTAPLKTDLSPKLHRKKKWINSPYGFDMDMKYYIIAITTIIII